MKKTYYSLILIGFLSIASIFILYLRYYNKLKSSSYDFKREIQFVIKSLRHFDLKYNSFYIAGDYNKDIYLGNYTVNGYLLKIDPLLIDTQSVVIKKDKGSWKSNELYTIRIDPNHFYLFNGAKRSILFGDNGTWLAKENSVFKPYFQEAIAINPGSIVFRYISNKTNSNSLRKESFSTKRIENSNILEKQVDGLFCTTGILGLNRQLNHLTYMYLYRNQILVIDTNMNVIKKIKTIDPIDSAKFEVSTIKSDHSKVFSSPPLLVNSKCDNWKNYLFIHSKLMGRHEDDVLFRNSTVIDIYDLQKGIYCYSIYLPNQDNKPITQFRVIENYIYTISGRTINRYEVELP